MPPSCDDSAASIDTDRIGPRLGPPEIALLVRYPESRTVVTPVFCAGGPASPARLTRIGSARPPAVGRPDPSRHGHSGRSWTARRVSAAQPGPACSRPPRVVGTRSDIDAGCAHTPAVMIEQQQHSRDHACGLSSSLAERLYSSASAWRRLAVMTGLAEVSRCPARRDGPGQGE